MNSFRIVTNGGMLSRAYWKVAVHGRDLRDGGTEVSIKDLVAFLAKEGFVTPVPSPEEELEAHMKQCTGCSWCAPEEPERSAPHKESTRDRRERELRDQGYFPI